MKFRLAAFAAIAVATLSGCQMTCSSRPLAPTCGSPQLMSDPACGSPNVDPTCGSPNLYADTGGCSGGGCDNFAPVVSSSSHCDSGGCGSAGHGFGIGGGRLGIGSACPNCGTGLGAGGCGGCGLTLPSLGHGAHGLLGGIAGASLLPTQLAAKGIEHALHGTQHGQRLMQHTAQACANGMCNRPMGPESGGQVQWPYYTTRGPRDFFLDNPPSIGP